MYCSNCGKPVNENAAVCMQCGFMVGTGSNYCPNCGTAAIPGANVCTTCGCMLPAYINSQAKSRLAAGLLGIFLGAFGVHNFYLGYTGKAIAQLLITVLTCGIGAAASSIWGFIEGILLIADKSSVDAKGIPLKD